MQKAIIISAPSGAGKTSIVKCLLEKIPGLHFSISATTRNKRQGETDGIDYFFMTQEKFNELVRTHQFVEWEEVYPGIKYGTLKSEIKRIWDQKGTVIFDVDVKGGMNLKTHFGNNALAVFIKVKDIQTLRERLHKRDTENKNSLETRLKKASSELAYEGRFDVTVVNDTLDQACKKTCNLVREFLSSD